MSPQDKQLCLLEAECTLLLADYARTEELLDYATISSTIDPSAPAEMMVKTIPELELRAELFICQGKLEQAMGVLEEALTRAKSSAVREDRWTYISILTRIAECYRQFDSTTMALKYISDARSELEKLYLEDSTSVMHDEEMVLESKITALQGRIMLSIDEKASIQLFSDALKMRAQYLPTSHPKRAALLHMLGLHALKRSKFSGAHQLVELALGIMSAVYPSNHPAIASTLVTKGRGFIHVYTHTHTHTHTHIHTHTCI
jgi:tetratricopeptide (TPR) repeat protein